MAMNNPDPAHLLKQIAQIQRMERGKLSVIREGPEGPYYKLQAWEDGKNMSRYVPSDQAAAVQKAIDGYQQFNQLTEHYAQQVIEKTRAELLTTSKKNGRRSRHKSSSPKIRKSSN
jgi:hypothetical protein